MIVAGKYTGAVDAERRAVLSNFAPTSARLGGHLPQASSRSSPKQTEIRSLPEQLSCFPAPRDHTAIIIVSFEQRRSKYGQNMKFALA